LNSVPKPGAIEASIAYRPALDGVRALAIVSVILYHLGYRWMRGGFLGVDIFFVLSGYLITSLLLAEKASLGEIRLAAFWARRARRLFPALAAAILGIALCVHYFEAVQLWAMRRQDLLWTIFYSANWHQIASDQNYFAQWITASPLRHMWSLAIEEQFYVAWPVILLILTARITRVHLAAAIAVGVVASVIVMALVYDPAAPSRAYYGTDSRAHELLIGALLAVLITSGAELKGRLGRSLGLIGAIASVLIVVALVFMPDSAPMYYRGGSVALSAVVAVLLWSIEARQTGLLARLLGLGVPRWIGKVSYGLYLWHWPVIIFSPSLLYGLGGTAATRFVTNSTTLNIARIGLTVGAATFSYYAVERPIRRGQVGRLLTNARLAFAVPTAAAALVAVALIATEIPVDSRGLLVGDSYQCANNALVCVRLQAAATRPTIVLMGDSIAKSLDPAFMGISQQEDWTYAAAAEDRCTLTQRWIADYTTREPIRLANWQPCYDSIPVIDTSVLRLHPSLIVATDRWLLIDSFNDAGKRLTAGTDEHITDIEGRLTKTAELLTSDGAQLVFIHILPVGSPPQCADPSFRSAPECTVPASSDTLTPKYNAMLDRIAVRLTSRVKVIDVSDVVCPDDLCPTVVDGILIRGDGLHFTAQGAEWLEPFLQQRLRQVGALPG
jgi:peptidoglycan/LPS O-acetylase OafA/YrhL